jgi:hypothetical protein
MLRLDKSIPLQSVRRLFRDCDHSGVGIAAHDRGHHGRIDYPQPFGALVDRPLAQLGAKRRVVLSLPFFVPAIFAITQTDSPLRWLVNRTCARMVARSTADGCSENLSSRWRQWASFVHA